MVASAIVTSVWFASIARLGADALLVFPSAGHPLKALTFQAPTMSTFIGPQLGDASISRSGPVVLLDGDMCNPTGVSAPGAIILTTAAAVANAACSLEVQYLALLPSGAAAVIAPSLDTVPNVWMYAQDGTHGARTRHQPMLFVNIGVDADQYDALTRFAIGQNATVAPDVNAWQDTLSSWYYQLFVRILPSAVLIGSGVAAAIYLVGHMRILAQAYEGSVPSNCRSSGRYATFVRQSVGVPHVVLTIEATTSTLCGVVLAIGGFCSTANLQQPVVLYFGALMTGWSFASSVLAAHRWTASVTDVMPFQDVSWLTRVVRGDYRLASILLVVLPILCETASSTAYSMYVLSPLVEAGVSLMLFILQLAVGLNVLTSVLRYYLLANDVQRQTAVAIGNPQTAFKTVLARLGRCALGMSLSMVLVCCGTLLMGASHKFLFSPSGWTLSFSLSYAGRALDTAFRVAMFRPRSARRVVSSNSAAPNATPARSK
ncbi:Transmembrane protein [Plasmodiophora brassicae]